MTRSHGFRNKLIYLAILIGMLFPLYLLGQPAGGSTGDPGGQLTQMRTSYNIAESELGDINPASETMKLASLGLRGVAATLLWNKAHDYTVHHEWDRLKATLNNIALLQPHYEKVWEFQAHNLSYNVSSEFDDYRQRYSMVREGIEYLTRGVEQNRKAPRLVWHTGWFYGQKIGMSDEKRQFRRLFSDDDPQHENLREQNIAVDSPEARGPDGKPDNWLVGRQWLFHGYDIVDGGVKIRNQTPINFYTTGPKWRIKHAEAIESEGILDDRAKNAWQLAGDDWQTFGQRSIPTTSPFTIRLGSLDELRQRRSEKFEEFLQLAGETLQDEKERLLSSLTPEEQSVLEIAPAERDEAQHNLAMMAEKRLTPALGAVARKAPESVRLRAIELAAELEDLEARVSKTGAYRNQINYDYWRTLTLAEQEERTVQARRLLYEAEQANADADLDLAIQKYEESFALWAEIFDDYPVLLKDELSDDLMRSIRRYTVAIDRDTFADDFPLAAFVEVMESENKTAEEYARLRKLQAEKLNGKDAADPTGRERDGEAAPGGDSNPQPATNAADPAAATAPETDAAPADAAPETGEPGSADTPATGTQSTSATQPDAAGDADASDGGVTDEGADELQTPSVQEPSAAVDAQDS